MAPSLCILALEIVKKKETEMKYAWIVNFKESWIEGWVDLELPNSFRLIQLTHLKWPVDSVQMRKKWDAHGSLYEYFTYTYLLTLQTRTNRTSKQTLLNFWRYERKWSKNKHCIRFSACKPSFSSSNDSVSPSSRCLTLLEKGGKPTLSPLFRLPGSSATTPRRFFLQRG